MALFDNGIIEFRFSSLEDPRSEETSRFTTSLASSRWIWNNNKVNKMEETAKIDEEYID